MSYLGYLGSQSLNEDELKEFLGPDTSMIVQHDTLNPMFWNADKTLRREVRARMLEIANTFLRSIHVGEEKLPVRDIVFTGSNANFNYTKTSDVDLHIRMDFGAFETINATAAQTIFNKSRASYNSTRNISIRGFKVEVFVEGLDTPEVGGGVYSLVRNRWLKQPERLSRDPRDAEFKRNVGFFVKRWTKDLKKALVSSDVEVMFAVLKEIKAHRGAGINREGDGAPENAAYKVIRSANGPINRIMGNTGLFDRMWKAIDRIKDDNLSMPVPAQPLNEFFFAPEVKYSSTLHPAIFGADKMLKPEVRAAMQRIGSAFKEFIGLKRVIDVRFKGSMANYNYTKTSDIDIHLVANVNKRQMEYFDAKRVEWKEKYKNINIFGHPIELAIELPNHLHSSSAVYSVSKNEWLDAPVYKKPETNRKRADALYKEWQATLVAAIKTGNLRQIKKVESEIRAQRNKALPGSVDAGERRKMEVSDENVAYKRLRDTGILDKVKALYIEDKVQKLSIENRKGLLAMLGFGA